MPQTSTPTPPSSTENSCTTCGRRNGDARPACPDCPDYAADHAAGRRVVDAEVLSHGSDADRDALAQQAPQNRSNPTRDNFSAAGNGQNFGRAFGQTFGRNGFTFIRFGQGGSVNQNTCLAPALSLFLFFLCLFQYGILAAIGFGFFHLVGSAALGVYSMRQLMQGREIDPRIGQIGLRIAAFLLAAWLSGGLD